MRVTTGSWNIHVQVLDSITNLVIPSHICICLVDEWSIVYAKDQTRHQSTHPYQKALRKRKIYTKYVRSTTDSKIFPLSKIQIFCEFRSVYIFYFLCSSFWRRHIRTLSYLSKLSGNLISPLVESEWLIFEEKATKRVHI